MSALVLIAGFGPFEGVRRNASGEVARALEGAPPPGIQVRSRVLPVSFERAPPAWDEFLAAHGPAGPRALLGLGVQRKPTFRLEARARGRLERRDRPDVDGVSAAEAAPPDGADGGPRRTSFDLATLAAGLRAAGARPEEVSLSRDAGGYVCERSYHHLLRRAEELGIPGLFLHLPPLDLVPLPRQTRILGGLLPLLVR